MKRHTVALPIIATVMLIPAAAPSIAQADVTSCVIPSAAVGPMSPNQGPEEGSEGLLTDLFDTDTDDSVLGDPLTDTGSGNAAPDGVYQFDNVGQALPSLCILVDDPGESSNDTGLYSAIIDSGGTYDGRVCGVWVFDSGDGDWPHFTTIDLSPVPDVDPQEEFYREDIHDADYEAIIAGGLGTVTFSSVDAVGDDGLPGTEDDQHGTGWGTLAIHFKGNNCVTTDVQEMNISGAFTFVTS